MGQAPTNRHTRAIAIALVAGSLLAVYLFFAAATIPAPPQVTGHYQIGNALLMAVFFSYALFALHLSVPFGLAMYIGYVYMAVAKKRRAGLILFAAHYLFAAVVALPFLLHRTPGLIENTASQFAVLRARPLHLLLCIGPFLMANLWYLLRLSRAAPGKS